MSPALQSLLDQIESSESNSPACLERTLGGTSAVQLATLGALAAPLTTEDLGGMNPALASLLGTAINSDASNPMCLERDLGGAAGVQLAILAAALLARSGDEGEGGGEIVTPDVYHVTSAGNDSTGDGSMSSPYLTLQRAVWEGETSAAPYVVALGSGSYSTGSPGLDFLVGLRGMGVALTMATISISAGDSPDGGTTGGTGGSLTLELHDLTFSASCEGGNVTGGGVGGDGGQIDLRGNFAFTSLSVRGGENTDSSAFAPGGAVNLVGAVAAFGNTGIQPNDGSGTLIASFCDFRQLSQYPGTVESGNTAWFGSVPGTDRGGNSIW